MVASDGNTAVIDIRSMREKAAVGVPDVPSSARGRFIELEMAEIDRRLRGQLRSVDQVEAQVCPAWLKISRLCCHVPLLACLLYTSPSPRD